MKGQCLKNCDCAYRCPSDFNALHPRGNLETRPEPTKTPVTGAEHRILVVMGERFEHHEAEIASAPILKANGGIRYRYENSHSTLAQIEHTPTVSSTRRSIEIIRPS
jgi:hypothetical protein